MRNTKRQHRWLTLALCLCLLASVFPLSGTAFAAETADIWDGTADVSWYQDGLAVFHLQTAEELAGLAELVNAGNTFVGKTVYLDNDLDLSGTPWVSIGTSYTKYFGGVFDGQRHQVKNLTNIQSSQMYKALFGIVDGATIKNLGVVDADISSSSPEYQLGILADIATNATVRNCFTTGKVAGSDYGDFRIGGLIGIAEAETQVIGCYSSAVVTSKATRFADAVGGLVGAWREAGTSPLIADCYFDGEIVFGGAEVSNTQGKTTNVGGILGVCFGSVDNLKIKNCIVASKDIQSPEDALGTGNGGIWIAWYLKFGVPENCYWPVDSRNWPAAIELGKLQSDPDGALHFDCGTPTADFKADSVLQGLRANAQSGVEWVTGFEHPTFAWDLRGIPADYTAVETAKNKAPGDLNLYTPATADALTQALNQVVAGKSKAEQAAVDAMAQAIDTALAALTYKPADYGKVDEAIAKANALHKSDYKDFSAVDAAINAVVRGKDITEQAAIDAMAKTIEDAMAGLERLPANVGPINPPDPGKSIDTGKDLLITFAGAWENVVDIRINGVSLFRTATSGITADLSGYKDYGKVLGMAKRSSVAVTLYKEFLRWLPDGRYTLEVEFLDGGNSAVGSAEFTVKHEIQPSPSPSTPTDSPQTDDRSSPWPWVLLMLASLMGCGGFLFAGKRRRKIH